MPKSRQNGQKPNDSSDSQDQNDSGPPKPAEKPISLHPLEFEEAVRGLLQTHPPKRIRRKS